MIQIIVRILVAERDSFKDIQPKDITLYLKKLGEQYSSQKSIDRFRLILNLIFKYAIEAGELQYNPCSAAKQPKGLEKTKRTAASETDEKIIKKNTLGKRIVAAVLAVVLCGALVYYNFFDKVPEAVTGAEVGQMCPSEEIPLYNSDQTFGFSVTTTNSKVRVINFWGTWCGPCIAELPHFEEVAREYADTVTVVAVHSNYKASTAAEWIAKNYPETSILFAQDPDDGVNGAYYTALGGEGDFPMTIIVDAEGVITFTRRGSLTHDELVAAVEEALGK